MTAKRMLSMDDIGDQTQLLSGVRFSSELYRETGELQR